MHIQSETFRNNVRSKLKMNSTLVPFNLTFLFLRLFQTLYIFHFRSFFYERISPNIKLKNNHKLWFTILNWGKIIIKFREKDENHGASNRLKIVLKSLKASYIWIDRIQNKGVELNLSTNASCVNTSIRSMLCSLKCTRKKQKQWTNNWTKHERNKWNKRANIMISEAVYSNYRLRHRQSWWR